MKYSNKYGKRLLLLMLSIILLTSCQIQPKRTRYSHVFDGAFDTSFQLIAYTENQKQFDEMSTYVQERMEQLHRLFDKYHSYKDLVNLRTVNEKAGAEPQVVDQALFDLLHFAVDMNQKTSGKTNIAFGAVLEIWSEYRNQGIDDPDNASLPPLEELQKAAEHTNISHLVLDQDTLTVSFLDPQLKLDVGAVAKGYATELVIQELLTKGYDSFIISSGGNIRAVGKPYEKDRSKWGVGLQDPNRYVFGDDNTLDTVYVNNMSVVSSGDYQRYYYVEDQRIHHLIDPATLYPANYYRAVNVLYEDSGKADFYSTEVFLLPYEESRAFVEATPGLEAQWIFDDGRIEMTKGFAALAKSQGAVPN